MAQPWEPETWVLGLRAAFRQPQELLDYLGLEIQGVSESPEFPMVVPRTFADRMRADPADPLLRQVLPLDEEAVFAPGFVDDPLAESHGPYVRAPGVIQKYAGRALLIASPACAVHCRYCFRRHFAYDEHRSPRFHEALRSIATDPTLSEVILSGGDPLLLGDRPLAQLVKALSGIEHVERIRIHTRIPIVLPERVTQRLIDTLRTSRAAVVVVVHANHPAELNEDTARALACLKNAGVWLLNQSVLLRGVNDCAQSLVTLSCKLFEQSVLPYYLHLLDPVSGSHHFAVSRPGYLEIYAAMQAALPGYLLPKLVQEIPGAHAKMPVDLASDVS